MRYFQMSFLSLFLLSCSQVYEKDEKMNIPNRDINEFKTIMQTSEPKILYIVKVKDTQNLISYCALTSMPSGVSASLEDAFIFNDIESLANELKDIDNNSFTIFSTDDESIIDPTPWNAIIPLNQADFIFFNLKGIIKKKDMPIFSNPITEPPMRK